MLQGRSGAESLKVGRSVKCGPAVNRVFICILVRGKLANGCPNYNRELGDQTRRSDQEGWAATLLCVLLHLCLRGHHTK